MLMHQAPAKVNVGLAIQRKRPDGYHDIATLFLKISLVDTLSFEIIPRQIVVECDHPEVPSDAQNLVYRAAALLQPCVPGYGVHIHLQKAIPVAAGLGGGSSDAAATLLGLNALWDLRLSSAELRQYGAQLGADVPFFLLPTNAALGVGRGDELEPMSCPWEFFLVLVTPPLAVSTAWIYQHFRFGLTPTLNNTNILKQHLESGDIASLGGVLFNDLETVVLPRFPVVQEVKRALRQPGVVGVSMSGSGPTVYALCLSREVAQEVAGAVAQRGWQVWMCHPWRETTPKLA
jgi:4-diphosphocytidyl-2-C-methyl-D-erythritol kinase